MNDLILSTYKEPLIAVTDGFGFLGAVASTSDGSRIQCHICGKLCISLARHITMAHRMKVYDYKKKFGLSLSVALISEQQRIKLSSNFKIRMLALSTEKKKEREEHRLAAIQDFFSKPENRTSHFTGNSLETKNKRGNCPEQLKEKVVNLYKELGRTPSLEEFNEKYTKAFVYSINQTFGGWRKLVQATDLPAYEKKAYAHKYDSDTLLEYIRSFYVNHGREPNTSDMKRGYLPRENHYYRVFGTFTKARELAFTPKPKSTPIETV